MPPQRIIDQSKPPVAIIGAGIAGLTAATAFSACGYRVEIFERSSELQDIGAGLQLSPNATRILGILGLTDRLAHRWRVPQSINLLSGKTLRPLARVPLGDTARHRWSAPYAVVHRAGLQRVLADAVQASPECRLHLGTAINGASEVQIVEQLAELAGQEPKLIIFADGVWSKIRENSPVGPARFTGYVAWRALAERDRMPFLEFERDVNAWLGPGTHIVTYPLGASNLVNAVAITPGHVQDLQWDARGDPEQLSAHFAGWHPQFSDCLAQLDWRFWPLFEARKDLWRTGSRSVAIGDAAHAMTPFAAQGAAMAIEDAHELATRFHAAKGHLRESISGFEAARRPRIARVRRRGDFNRFTYHATGPFRLGRDALLALRNGPPLMKDFDWLYGYSAGSDKLTKNSV